MIDALYVCSREPNAKMWNKKNIPKPSAPQDTGLGVSASGCFAAAAQHSHHVQWAGRRKHGVSVRVTFIPLASSDTLCIASPPQACLQYSQISAVHVQAASQKGGYGTDSQKSDTTTTTTQQQRQQQKSSQKEIKCKKGRKTHLNCGIYRKGWKS